MMETSGQVARAVRRPARSRLCLFNRTMHEGDLRSVGAHGLETGAIIDLLNLIEFTQLIYTIDKDVNECYGHRDHHPA